jgi:hypothetical protein
MGKDLKRMTSLSDKFKYLFKKPGWLPDYLGGYQAAPDVDKDHYSKYNTPAPQLLNWYVVFQYALCLAGTALFLFSQKLPDGSDRFSLLENGLITLLISIVVVNCGVLFEKRSWVYTAEWIRIFFYPAMLMYFTVVNQWPIWWYGVAISYLFISFIWFSAIQKQTHATTI